MARLSPRRIDMKKEMTRNLLAIRGKTGKHLARGEIRDGKQKPNRNLGSRWDNYVSKFISYRCLMDRATIVASFGIDPTVLEFAV